MFAVLSGYSVNFLSAWIGSFFRGWGKFHFSDTIKLY